MGSKLLFILGIVAAHSALAAAWVQQEPLHQRTALLSTSCVSAPDSALPDFTPRAEIYAATFMRAESISESMQP
jgi:hypothetical protein